MLFRSPFQLTTEELESRLNEMVAVTFDDLTSQFMLLPRGRVFLTYPEFLHGYELLRMATRGFRDVNPSTCWNAMRDDARSFLVIRTILGMSPPEWRELANDETGTAEAPNSARAIDGNCKKDPSFFTTGSGRSDRTVERVTQMLTAACKVLTEGADVSAEDVIHRLDKFDTQGGLSSVRHAATEHIPYAVLLYERFLGRPFASHRDAVSELVGDVMENAIEDRLTAAGVPYRKTKRAERVAGFDQAPDFFIPDEVAPTVIIEAKVIGDDGTARDKVARILRLAQMRDSLEKQGLPAYEVVACIDGRGFGVRSQDCKDLLRATRGKVFTFASLDELVPNTLLADFVIQN